MGKVTVDRHDGVTWASGGGHQNFTFALPSGHPGFANEYRQIGTL